VGKEQDKVLLVHPSLLLCVWPDMGVIGTLKFYTVFPKGLV